jgi:glycosyltransferase involved in cell wall biosynthesis
MKVDMVIASFMQGGAQRQCAWLANAMAEDPDIEVRVLYFRESDNIGQLNTTAVTAIRLPSSSFYSLGNVARVVGALRKHRPDFVISWLHATDVIMGLSRPFLLRGTSWILAERDSAYPPNWRYALRRYLGANSDAIIANSLRGREYWISAGYSKDKIFVADNILSPEIVTAPPAERRFDFVYAGRLEPQKNIEPMTEAFARLARKRPELTFGIIGDGSLREQVKQKVASHGVAGRVTLEPYDPQIASLFKTGPIFVNISHHEGLPNTILENVACGNRIVASFIPEHVEILGSDYPHFVCNHTDPDTIVQALERALTTAWSGFELDHARARLKGMNPGAVVARYKSIFRTLERS